MEYPKIYTYPEDKKTLRKISKPIENIKDHEDLIFVMTTYLDNHDIARGLAAVQLGYPLNIISIKLWNKP